MASASKSRRRLWFSLHSWAGMKLSLLFFFVSLTGTIAVYAYEVDWLFTPAMRVQAPSPDAERLPAGTQLAAALQQHPNWTPSFFHVNLPGYMASELIAKDEEGELRRVYINPYTAEVQGVADWFNAHRFLRQAHRHLMLPLKWGLTIVALLSIPLLLSMISAFPIFKRWWRGFFKLPQSTDPPRRWWGNLHRWLGLWSLPFILIIGLTSFWYLIEQWGAAAPSAASALPPPPEAGPLPREAAPLNRALEAALAQWPGYRLESLFFRGDNQPVVLQGQDSALLVRPRTNILLLDPAAGEVLGQFRGEQLTAHQRIAEAADPLHFGTFGGQPTRFLWFLWGLMLTLLSASGVWIYALRLAPKAATSRWRTLWRGQLLRWPQLALVLTCLTLVAISFSG
ncbi:PepSY-associated TM helix domain-containing protein [Marinimicrobium locisalis]|uniref:PepSY-associated TM helix domain-containing protein n=1 Tax=Marinimicrobium locisalis TaxID=546022 RepID=UPI0032218ADA